MCFETNADTCVKHGWSISSTIIDFKASSGIHIAKFSKGEEKIIPTSLTALKSDYNRQTTQTAAKPGIMSRPEILHGSENTGYVQYSGGWTAISLVCLSFSSWRWFCSWSSSYTQSSQKVTPNGHKNQKQNPEKTKPRENKKKTQRLKDLDVKNSSGNRKGICCK